MIPTVAGEGVPQYHERGMDPPWESAVANDMSVNIHAGTARARNKKTSHIQVSGGRNPTKSPLKYEFSVKPILNMTCGGVFELNTKLTFISAKTVTGWAPHNLQPPTIE